MIRGSGAIGRNIRFRRDADSADSTHLANSGRRVHFDNQVEVLLIEAHGNMRTSRQKRNFHRRTIEPPLPDPVDARRALRHARNLADDAELYDPSRRHVKWGSTPCGVVEGGILRRPPMTTAVAKSMARAIR